MINLCSMTLNGPKLTIFYAESNPTYFTWGGGHICPPMISRGKKVFCPIPFAHSNNYPKKGYTLKTQVSNSKKNKKWRPF